MDTTPATYQVTVLFTDGTQVVTATDLTRREAWALVIRLGKRGYTAGVTTPDMHAA